VSAPVLELADVLKNYHALRPLRVSGLSLQPGEHVALVGLDQHAAEVLINVVTGAVLPDRGEIRVHGRPTSSVKDSTEWLALVDRFGIVSERAVLLDGLTVVQNLALPFSLDIEPPDAALRDRAIALGRDVGLAEADWDRRLNELTAAGRLRVRLGRALALDPDVVLLEHPSAGLDRTDIVSLGRDIRARLERRRRAEGLELASLTLTADPEFADAVATRVLVLDPASGRLTDRRRRGWFGRGTASL
jgi:ABC-type transporter Mla maintaining outer membrane lipid asymmetry ATPase subunit MlaF